MDSTDSHSTNSASTDEPHDSDLSHSDGSSFYFDESEDKDAEEQLLAALEEEKRQEQWQNGMTQQHEQNEAPIPVEKHPLVSQSRRDEKFQAQNLSARESLSARKRLSMGSSQGRSPAASIRTQQKPAPIMTPRTNYYDRLRRIQRVHSSPKFLFRGGIGVAHFNDVALGDSLVSNFELLDKRKQLMKKYTTVHSSPYQPTGKYEEPKHFLHERLATEQKDSPAPSPNTYERRKQYGKKVWKNVVKKEDNKYKQMKRAQTLNELDALRQEWIQLNHMMQQMDPRMMEQIPTLDNDTVSLSEEMEDMQSQLWPDVRLRPQANVVSTENHRLLNSSLRQAIDDEEDVPQETPETINHPYESPSQSKPQRTSGRRLFLQDTSPLRASPKPVAHSIRIPSPVFESPLPEDESPQPQHVSPVRTPTRSGSMEPSQASELLTKAKSVLRRTSQLFERFDEAIGQNTSGSQLNGSFKKDSFTYDSADHSELDSENHDMDEILQYLPQDVHEETMEQMMQIQSEIPIVPAPPPAEPLPEVRDGDLPFVFQFFPAEHVHGMFALVCSTWFNITRTDRMWHLLYQAKYGVALNLAEDARPKFMERLRLERTFSLCSAACFHTEREKPFSELYRFPSSQLQASHLQRMYHLNQLDRVRKETAQRVERFLSAEWFMQAPFSVLAKELFPDLIFGSQDKKDVSEGSTQQDMTAEIFFLDKSKEYETKVKEAQEQLNKSKMVISAHPLNKEAKNRASIMKQLPQQEAQLKKLIKRLEKEELETDREREQFFSDVPFYREKLVNNWRKFIDARGDLFSRYANPYNIIVSRHDSNVSVTEEGELEYAEIVSEMIVFGTKGEETRLECMVRTHPDSKTRTGVAHEFDLVLKLGEESFFPLFDENEHVDENALEKLCTVLLGDRLNAQDEILRVGCLWFTLMLLMPTEAVCKVPNDEFLFQLFHKSSNYRINYDSFGYHMLRKGSESRPRVSKQVSGGTIPALTLLPAVQVAGRATYFNRLQPPMIHYICGFLRYQDLVPGALMINKQWNLCVDLYAPRSNTTSALQFWRQMFSNELGAPLDFIHQDPKDRFMVLWRKITEHRFVPFTDFSSLEWSVGTPSQSNKMAMTLCAEQIAQRLDTFLNHPDALMKYFDLQVEGPPKVDVDSLDVWKFYLQRHRYADFLTYFTKHSVALFVQDCKLQITPRKSSPHKIDIISYSVFLSIHYRGVSLKAKLLYEFHTQRKRSSPYTFKVEYKGGEEALQQFMDIFLTHELGIHLPAKKESKPAVSPSPQKHARGPLKRPSSAAMGHRRSSIQSPPAKKSGSTGRTTDFTQFLQLILRYTTMPFDFLLKADGMENATVFQFVRDMHREFILNVMCNTYNAAHQLPYFKSIRPIGSA